MRWWKMVLMPVLALGALSGCTVGEGGDTGFGGTTWGGPYGTTSTGGSGSSSGGADGSEEGGFTPDPVACTPKPCTVPEDCCEGSQPGIPSACDGPLEAGEERSYPNRWSCISDVCVNDGCANDSDCVLPDLSCVQVGGVGTCVPVCNDDDDCTLIDDVDGDDLVHGIPFSECIGLADAGSVDDGLEFCVQPLPPPGGGDSGSSG